MQKFSLRCFGVGDGWPCAERNRSSFLYRFGRTRLMIDCGEPLGRSYEAAGCSYDAVDRLFISHFHADHFGGFFMLVQGFWLGKRQKDLTVHCPGNGIEPLRQMLNTAMLFDELMDFELSFQALAAGSPVEVGTVRVTPYRTTHIDDLKQAFGRLHPQPYDAFSFLLECGKIRVAHSADIGRPEDLDPLLAKPVDLLVCELAHFKPDALFRYLAGREVRKIVFIHLSRRNWNSIPALRRQAEAYLPGIPMEFARDNDEFHL